MLRSSIEPVCGELQVAQHAEAVGVHLAQTQFRGAVVLLGRSLIPEESRCSLLHSRAFLCEHDQWWLDVAIRSGGEVEHVCSGSLTSPSSPDLWPRHFRVQHRRARATCRQHGSTMRYRFCTAERRRFIVKAVLAMPFLAFAVACGGPRCVEEVPIDLGLSSLPVAIIPAADAGYFVPVQSAPVRLLKTDQGRRVKWSFAPSFGPDVTVQFSMATALRDGGVLICGSRHSFAPNRHLLPGFLIRLDAAGHEVSRLDPLSPGYSGPAFYQPIACSPWGNGFVMSSLQIPEGSQTDFDLYRNSAVTVNRLSGDFSTIWGRAIHVGGVGEPTAMAPKELPSGDLIFPSEENIVLLDQSGNVKAQAAMGMCRWVRSTIDDQALRFGCVDDSVEPHTTIVEYDNALGVIGRLQLIGATGFPIIAKLNGSGYFTFDEAENYKRRVAHYGADGRLVGQSSFSAGVHKDVAVSKDGLAVISISAIQTGDHFSSAMAVLEP